MKKMIAVILFALCSISFSQPCERTDQVSGECASDTLSVAVSDSALYYEEMSAKLKTEGEQLLEDYVDDIVAGVFLGTLGAVGTIWSVSASSGASLEGGGVLVVFIMAPSACLLMGGVFGVAGGIGKGIRGNRMLEQSEEYKNSAERYRTKSQQVKVDFVPLLNPLTKTVGMDLALKF
jgi:hypothetical protein